MSVHRVTVQSLCQFAKLIWLAHAGITEMSDIITELRGKLKRKKKLNSHRTLRSVEHHHSESFKNTKNPTQILEGMPQAGQESKLALRDTHPARHQGNGGLSLAPLGLVVAGQGGGHVVGRRLREPRLILVVKVSCTKTVPQEVTQHFLKNPAVLQVTSMSPTAQALRAVPFPATPAIPKQKPKAQEHLCQPELPLNMSGCTSASNNTTCCASADLEPQRVTFPDPSGY